MLKTTSGFTIITVKRSDKTSNGKIDSIVMPIGKKRERSDEYMGVTITKIHRNFFSFEV